MSKVVFLNVEHEPNGVQNAVKRALELLDWKRFVKGKKIFVKVNLISSEFVVGQCTSPLVLDGLFEVLKNNGFDDVVFGDANLAAAKQCNKAAKVWGHLKLAKKYGFRFQNLSEDEMERVQINGRVFDALDVPRCVLNADSIISIPVMKTHCLTTITCALKHFWGVVPRVRHQYHLVVDEAIADINQFLKPKVSFILVDGTVCMEGNAPRTGKPKICDKILASYDPVALDATAAKYMDLETPQHVKVAAERGLGSINGELIGDEFVPSAFEPAQPNRQPIFFWEMSLRRTFLKPLLFDTPIFSVLSWIATKYNTFYYYRRYGKKYAEEVMTTWYGEEIDRLLNPRKDVKELAVG